MSRAANNKPMTRKQIPVSWDKLIRMHPLRPIHDDVELANATEIIDAMAGHELNPDQEDYLDALSTLIEAYEAEHHPIDVSGVSGIEILRSLLKDHGMSATDLARLLGVHRSHGAKILRGERSLTTTHLKILAEKFKVRPELFLD